jgi:hypothetical protein
VRLIKGAWRAGYRGFACIVAVARDTGFGPVDARTLTPGDIRGDQTDWWFFIKRGKTGDAAIGTPRIRHLIHAYVYSLDIELMDTAPIFQTRGYAPSIKGGRPSSTRMKSAGSWTCADRVPSYRWRAVLQQMPTKLAYSMDQDKLPWRIDLPVEKATVRGVDQARQIGRQKLRTEHKADKTLKLGKEKS